MIIIKFALIIFLLALAFFLTYLSQAYQIRPGLNYYIDMGSKELNSIQPAYKISYVTALEHPHALEISCFPGGLIYRITKFSYGLRGSSQYFFIDGYHRLRYNGTQMYWDGPISMRQASPPPPDPAP